MNYCCLDFKLKRFHNGGWYISQECRLNKQAQVGVHLLDGNTTGTQGQL